jgi:hypothetical protein
LLSKQRVPFFALSLLERQQNVHLLLMRRPEPDKLHFEHINDARFEIKNRLQSETILDVHMLGLLR